MPMRSPILYLIAYIPLLIISITFSYLGYQWKVKKYRKIFFRSLRKHGISRKIAKRLCREIRTLGIRDFLKYGNMKSMWKN